MLTLTRKVNSVSMKGHLGAMEYQPGILEVPNELRCEAQWPLLEQWRLSLGYYWSSGGGSV
jgi:hypothetical protein